MVVVFGVLASLFALTTLISESKTARTLIMFPMMIATATQFGWDVDQSRALERVRRRSADGTPRRVERHESAAAAAHHRGGSFISLSR